MLDGGVATELSHARTPTGRSTTRVGHARADRDARDACSASTARTSTRAATSSRPTRGGCARRWPPKACTAPRRHAGALDGPRPARAAPRARGGRRATAGGASARSRSRSTATIDSEMGGETGRLLARLFADEPEPPDLILLETLSVLPESLDARSTSCWRPGCPVWLSFRRCRHGLCGVYGQHWGGPGGRRVRPRGAALRGDGRAGAADQLHPARPRRRAWSPTCATSSTCRSACIPTSATSPTAAGARTPGRGRRVRGARAAVA